MKKVGIIVLLLASIVSFGQTLIDPAQSPTTARINAALSGAVGTSGTNTYVGSLSGITSYTNLSLDIQFAAANTGASTFNLVGSTGAVALKKYSSGSLVDFAAGDISAGQRIRFYYNGTYLVMMGGGGGTSLYTGSSPTTVTVGGLSSGTSISGQTVSQVLQSILVPYINPQFTSFSVSQASTVEVGTTLSGLKTYTWAINVGSGTVSTIDIYDNTAGSTLLAATPNDGTQNITITTIQLNSNGATQSWKGIGNNSSPTGTFNSSNYTVTSYFYYWFAPVSSTVNSSATIRALAGQAFYTGPTTFILNTGTALTKFDTALPPGKSITQVIDLDALNANITSQYISQGNVNVLDAGSTNRSYQVYEMTVGTPYGTSHRHQITTN